MKTNTSLAMLIYTRREEMGITQKQLAKKMNVSQRTIYYWETDSERKPQLSSLIQLSKTLNIAIEDMLLS